MQEQIQKDLKNAMLASDSLKVEVLKGLKSAVHNREIETKQDLKDEEIINIVKKEVKKRQEAAELYAKAGSSERESKELSEAEVLQAYLPKQLSDEELEKVVEGIIADNNIDSPQKMGMAIGLANKEVGAKADGARIAATVKKKLGV